MKTITIKVDNVQLNGPKQGKRGEFYILNIEGGGKKFGQIQFDSDVAVSIGDTVNIAYETEEYALKNGSKGTNNKIIRLDILQGEDLGDVQVASSPVKTTAPQQPKSVGQVTYTPAKGTANTPNKDISMEVSGLLQAIIHKHGLDENTESLLRTALQLKRQVATELETTGSV